MKISLDWLSDFITLTETDPNAIARTMTEKVAEVDEAEEQGSMLRDVVVGKILTLKRHPGADRLSLCDVRTDRGVKKVVCGGTNLREGMRVAFAHVGATVRWHGTETVTLEKTKIRGEESEGMICAAEELELQSRFPQEGERSVIDLGDGDRDVGASMKEFLGMGDVVLHVDNHAITHRPDLFSHRGFAREFVAAGLGEWKEKKPVSAPSFPASPFPFSVTVEQKKLVPRYEACMLEIDGLGETPDWMKRRLEATGWRSINLPIDITNYVMMETGMPLHSFDAADIKGNVRMRRARKKEKIVTLDEQERELSPGALVMEDDEGIFDLLGIMGGLRGSTKASTRKIWLHSAVVDPVNTRRTVIAMGHRTDAATIYEKGVPLASAREGLFRALELFLAHVPGAKLVSAPLSWGEDGTAKPITLRMSRLRSLLGIPVEMQEASNTLRALGFRTEESGKSLRVTPPLWRSEDIHGEHDLIEEIGRIHGYDSIPPILPHLEIAPPHRDFRLHAIRDALREERYAEVMPLSLVGKALLEKAGLPTSDAAAIVNPLGEELRHPHTSVLPGLLENAQRNLKHAGASLRTFTWSRVFKASGEEYPEMALLRADLEGKTDLKNDPFLLLKQDVERALAPLHLAVTLDRNDAPAPYEHPGRSATLFAGGEPVGSLFELHPEIRARFDLPHRAAAAVFSLPALLSQAEKPAVSTALPQFPSVSYDVTVTRTQDRNTRSLLAELRKASPLLENVEIVDLFSGKPLDPHEFKLTLRFTYRAPDRTLTEDEAKAEQGKVEKALAMA